MKFNGHILAQEYSIQVYYTGVFFFKMFHFLDLPFNPNQYGGGALWPPYSFPQYLQNDLS